MENTNSVYNKYSRYVGGGTTEIADGKIEWWDRNIFPADNTDIYYAVENIYAGRIDKIATAFYGEDRYWWVIAQFNNILDPLTEIVAGRVLMIPTKDRLSLMLSSKQGGIASVRQPINTISPVII